MNGYNLCLGCIQVTECQRIIEQVKLITSEKFKENNTRTLIINSALHFLEAKLTAQLLQQADKSVDQILESPLDLTIRGTEKLSIIMKCLSKEQLQESIAKSEDFWLTVTNYCIGTASDCTGQQSDAVWYILRPVRQVDERADGLHRTATDAVRRIF